MRRSTASLLTLSAALLASTARADPPTLRAAGSLREGLVVEGCRGARCEPWVRFPARPYRSFIEARVSPTGRFFYVWSRPDGGPREVDVFAVPTREAQLANRRGHWSPGAGGELEWVVGDRLWHAWRCGADCGIGQLYTVTGATLVSVRGVDVERARDGRFAVVATPTEGVLVDLARATMRTFRGPAGSTYVARALTLHDDRAELGFEPASYDDNDRADAPRTLRIPLPNSANAPAQVAASPARPPAATRPATPRAPATSPPRAAPARRPALRAAVRATRPSR